MWPIELSDIDNLIRRKFESCVMDTFLVSAFERDGQTDSQEQWYIGFGPAENGCTQA